MVIYIINGPNLNALGQREPEIYGKETLEDTISSVRRAYPEAVYIDIQTNHEGDIIDALYDADKNDQCIGIILNPGAFAHYSYAIADAISSIDKPVVEVHISNIHSREGYRSKTVTGAKARVIITGAGRFGYILAAQYLLHLQRYE